MTPSEIDGLLGPCPNCGHRERIDMVHKTRCGWSAGIMCGLCCERHVGDEFPPVYIWEPEGPPEWDDIDRERLTMVKQLDWDAYKKWRKLGRADINRVYYPERGGDCVST